MFTILGEFWENKTSINARSGASWLGNFFCLYIFKEASWKICGLEVELNFIKKHALNRKIQEIELLNRVLYQEGRQDFITTGL